MSPVNYRTALVLTALAQAWGAAWLLLAAAATPAQASVRALPTPGDSDIERSTVNAASPRAQGPDNPLQEQMLQKLRSAAQREAAPSRKPRTGPGAAPRTSADLAPADAAWLLGLLSLHGLAMPADPPQAQHWFERAQMLGHPLAPAGLAWCQISGCVSAPNPSTAMHWIALVSRTDPGLAKYLEWHAAKALAPLADPTAASARPDAAPSQGVAAGQHLQKLLADAARAGNAQAGNELGLEWLAKGELDKALGQFQSVAERSEAAAANAGLLASRIRSGPAGRTRPARYSPADWFAQAQRYHQGDGVPANYTEAVRLYQIAASGGDPQARKMLELIFSRPLQGGGIDIAWMQQLANIPMGSSITPGAAKSFAPHGWQRDPSPLYALVPLQWRTPEALPRR
jgi:TPR repeat protein